MTHGSSRSSPLPCRLQLGLMLIVLSTITRGAISWLKPPIWTTQSRPWPPPWYTTRALVAPDLKVLKRLPVTIMKADGDASDLPATIVGLDENQRAAVESGMGAIRVVAGPGSGKTRVLTRRIAHLVQVEGVKPWRILAVTFTNKAAAEMRERLDGLLGPSSGCTVGTFHSVCVKILRRSADSLAEVAFAGGIDGRFTVCDTNDGARLMRELMQARPEEKGGTAAAAKKAEVKEQVYLRAISNLKNSGIHPTLPKFREAVHEAMGGSAGGGSEWDGGSLQTEDVIRVFTQYHELLRERNMLDFDDLLLLTLELVKSVPSVRARLQAQWHHVLVDEWQDTNVPQYDLIKHLTHPALPEDEWWSQRSLMVVGDMDQSIYGWRGADPRSLSRLEEDYPGCKTVVLNLNYRSTATIATAAQSVISRSKDWEQGGVKKVMQAVGKKGDAVSMVEVIDDTAEGHYVTRRTAELLKGGLKSVGVIFRTNAQSRSLEAAFIEAQIPHRVVGSLAFFSRKEVKDALAFLAVMTNPADRTSLGRIINVPPRKIGDSTAVAFFSWLSTLKKLNALEGLLSLLMGDAQGVARVQTVRDLYTEQVQKSLRVISGDDYGGGDGDDDVAPPPPPSRPWASMEEMQEGYQDAVAKLNTRQIKVLTAFAEVMATLILFSCAQSVPNVVSYIIEEVGLRAFAESSVKDEEKGREKGKNLEEVVRAAQPYKDGGPALSGPLVTFLEEAALAGGDPDDDEPVPVSLLTAHSSKGLEFDAVFVTGLERDTFPVYTKNPDKGEEERRLMFVAMTRAKRHLHLSWRRRIPVYKKGSMTMEESFPSPYLSDLPVDIVQCSRQWGQDLISTPPTSLIGSYGSGGEGAGGGGTRGIPPAAKTFGKRRGGSGLLPVYRDPLLMKGTSLTYNNNRKKSLKEDLRDEEAASRTQVWTLGSEGGLQVGGAREGGGGAGDSSSSSSIGGGGGGGRRGGGDKEAVIEDLREKIRKLEEQGQKTKARLGARLMEQAKADEEAPPPPPPLEPPSTQQSFFPSSSSSFSPSSSSSSSPYSSSSSQPPPPGGGGGGGQGSGRRTKASKTAASRAEAAAKKQAAVVSGLQVGWRVKHPTWGDGLIMETGEGAGGLFVRVDFVIGSVDLTGADAAALVRIQ